MSSEEIRTPMSATVVEIVAGPGRRVRDGEVVAIVEAMKMEHELRARCDGIVVEVLVVAGDLVQNDDVLMRIEAAGASTGPDSAAPHAVHAIFDGLRHELAAHFERHALTLDTARPRAIDKRHALGLRSARENVADLCDPGSFVEYGALAVAAQSGRRDADDLIRNTPADGMVTGIGTIGGTRCVVMAYDATVLAGTQGHRNHQKTDRMLAIADVEKLPVVLFAEGGGGRPGDVDMPIVAGLHVPTFASYARLSGRVPVVAIVAGRCFAGNAALAGCSDLIIATRGSNLGMGGPAMIEGGGLGVFRPEQIGPADVLDGNGVIDVLCDDEAAAVAVAKQYLGFLQGPSKSWTSGDQAALRDALPLSRVRAYDVRTIVKTLVDDEALLELRPRFGPAILTFLARIEGRSVGMLVSQSSEGGGAIDGDAADKAAQFIALCDRGELPIVSLIDTPGFMVGPDTEARGQVRHAGRLFIANAQLRVPLVAVVLRKAYGLGAMALTGGGFHAASAIVSWPTGEFGAMGLEGAVRLGYRKELEAAAAGPERDALYRRLVASQYERGSALNMAATLEIDAVIDPADTRSWIARRLGFM
ncbi:MAG: carboxyl transferase domain-containing protein [Burkholderiaceae bacterium]